jgi:hypothetical protein
MAIASRDFRPFPLGSVLRPSTYRASTRAAYNYRLRHTQLRPLAADVDVLWHLRWLTSYSQDTSGAGSMVLLHRGSELPHHLPTLSSLSDTYTKPNGHELLALALLRRGHRSCFSGKAWSISLDRDQLDVEAQLKNICSSMKIRIWNSYAFQQAAHLRFPSDG